MNQKIKIMKPPPKLSDDEIRSYMDFDTVLDHQRKLRARRNTLRWTAGAGSLALIIISGWMISGEFVTSNEEPLRMEVKNQNANVVNDTLGAESSADTPTTDALSKNIVAAPSTDSLMESARLRKRPSREPDQSAVVIKKAQDTLHQQHSTTNDVYHQAEPVGGYQNLYEYFNKNLKYPREVMADSLQETVTVTFVITASGEPDMIKLDDAVAARIRREVETLVLNMPSWKAATLNGKPVPSRITLPLTFKIEKITE
jgi:hypothetical protein